MIQGLVRPTPGIQCFTADELEISCVLRSHVRLLCRQGCLLLKYCDVRFRTLDTYVSCTDSIHLAPALRVVGDVAFLVNYSTRMCHFLVHEPIYGVGRIICTIKILCQIVPYTKFICRTLFAGLFSPSVHPLPLLRLKNNTHFRVSQVG